MQIPITCVILAAGLGTRMKSKKAKVLHRAGGLTLIEHVVRTSLALTPPERVIVVVGHQAEQVQAAVSRYGVRFVQQTEQKGTGHALLACGAELSPTDGLLLVLYGDCPLLSSDTLGMLVERQSASHAAATLITTVLDDPTGYGRVMIDEHGKVRAVIEQKAASPEQLEIREVNSGIYCFHSGLLWRYIDEIRPDNPAGEYYLTDIVEIFHRDGYEVEALRLDDPGELLGINTRLDLAAVDCNFRERKVRQLMLDGVTIEKPETVTIDAQVRVGPDTVIEPFAQVLGDTEIGEDCRIGTASIITDCRLADSVEVGPFTLINDSRVEAGAKIGPFARLRFDNQVGADAHIGNFVELKKTRLGAGAKAMHLAYLGDSVIGEEVNIGAGTITCNYDGVRKHQTTICRGAFVGSNSTLVAPVVVGEGSYVGAGSVITHPVPPDALAIGRARQIVKEGWARRRKEKASGN